MLKNSKIFFLSFLFIISINIDAKAYVSILSKSVEMEIKKDCKRRFINFANNKDLKISKISHYEAKNIINVMMTYDRNYGNVAICTCQYNMQGKFIKMDVQ